MSGDYTLDEWGAQYIKRIIEFADKLEDENQDGLELPFHEWCAMFETFLSDSERNQDVSEEQ